jgi:hypothetical protein
LIVDVRENRVRLVNAEKSAEPGFRREAQRG